MTEPHRPRGSFDTELNRLQQMLLDMAGRAEELVRIAMDGLSERDPLVPLRVRRADDRLNALEVELDERVLELLALQQPIATDLRLVFVALKASNDIERIGDHAVNIANASERMTRYPPMPDILEIAEISGQVRQMMRKALDAMVNRDAETAREVIAEDDRVDDLRWSAFRIIVSYMLEQPRYIGPGLELILVVQNLERIGDLTTNIAEDVVFLVEGTSIKHAANKAAGPG
ncbi:MAG: phosphate signaling complex protein PhoU [Gemmatimonadota bacterium]|nr:phosphate signaling complex protein PhoU [Gemmatimonadota bacterium]